MKYLRYLTAMVWGMLAGCDLQENEVLPADGWARIYESEEFSGDLNPLDVQPTADGGYIILAEAISELSGFPATYLFKVDEQGLPQWQHTSEKFVRPVSSLLPQANGGYTLVTSDSEQLGTHILRLEDNPAAPLSSQAYFEDYRHPLAANLADANTYTLLHWHPDAPSHSQMAQLAGGQTEWNKQYAVYENVEPHIMSHLTRAQQSRFPFMVGQVPGGYYFNGFNNFTLSLNFISNTGDAQGSLNGTRYASGINQVLPLSNNRLALSYYNESGAIYLLPNANLSATETLSASELPAYPMPELEAYAPVVIKEFSLLQEAVVLYASTTKNGRIALYAYNLTGELVGTYYLGSGNRFELGALTFTPEGNLVVLAKTYAAGRFSRPSLFKLDYPTVVKLVGK